MFNSVSLFNCLAKKVGGKSNCIQNTPGGRECFCNRGFLSHPHNHSICVDIDECTESNGGCDQICWNFPGGRRCDCRKGFQLLYDKLTCGDLNECTKQNGGCSHSCKNVEEC